MPKTVDLLFAGLVVVALMLFAITRDSVPAEASPQGAAAGVALRATGLPAAQEDPCAPAEQVETCEIPAE